MGVLLYECIIVWIQNSYRLYITVQYGYMHYIENKIYYDIKQHNKGHMEQFEFYTPAGCRAETNHNCLYIL